MTKAPRKIEGTAGSRVQVVLGRTGKEWILVMNNDDGERTWQTIKWNGIDPKLGERLTSCITEGLIVTHISYASKNKDTNEAFWYVAAKRKNYPAVQCWYHADDNVSESLRNKVFVGDKVSLGCKSGCGTLAVVVGANGFQTKVINKDLKARIRLIRDKALTIDYIQLFQNNSYFMKDGLGYNWRDLGKYLSEEVEKTKDTIHSVASAISGAWLVIYDNSYKCSESIDEVLQNELSVFLKAQRERSEDCILDIKKHDDEEVAKRSAIAKQTEKDKEIERQKEVEIKVPEFKAEMKDLKALADKYKKRYENALLDQTDIVDNLELQIKALKLNLSTKRQALETTKLNIEYGSTFSKTSQNDEFEIKEINIALEEKSDAIDNKETSQEVDS